MIDLTYFSYRVTLSVLGLLVLLATIHESWRMYRNVPYDPQTDGKTLSALRCFSFIHNGRKLLSFEPSSSSSDNLSCLHGIRVLSTFWVVIGHTWFKGVLTNSLNPKMAVDVTILCTVT